MTNNLVPENHPRSGDVKVNHIQAEERPIDQEYIFIIEEEEQQEADNTKLC